MSDTTEAIKTIGTASAVAATAGNIVIAVPVAAPGILGVIGLTTTATLVLPVAGVIAVGGFLTYGAMKVFKKN